MIPTSAIIINGVKYRTAGRRYVRADGSTSDDKEVWYDPEILNPLYEGITMSQFYIRVSKENQTTGEHASDDKAKAQTVFDELKKTAPIGSKLEFRDFGQPDSLIDSHVVKEKVS